MAVSTNEGVYGTKSEVIFGKCWGKQYWNTPQQSTCIQFTVVLIASSFETITKTRVSRENSFFRQVEAIILGFKRQGNTFLKSNWKHVWIREIKKKYNVNKHRERACLHVILYPLNSLSGITGKAEVEFIVYLQFSVFLPRCDVHFLFLMFYYFTKAHLPRRLHNQHCNTHSISITCKLWYNVAKLKRYSPKL